MIDKAIQHSDKINMYVEGKNGLGLGNISSSESHLRNSAVDLIVDTTLI